MVRATPTLEIEQGTMSIAFLHSTIELVEFFELKVVFPFERFYLRVCGNKVVGSRQITILNVSDLCTDAQEIRLRGIHLFGDHAIPAVLKREFGHTNSNARQS